MKEKTNLENISGGAGGASKYYCVEGYSETNEEGKRENVRFNLCGCRETVRSARDGNGMHQGSDELRIII